MPSSSPPADPRLPLFSPTESGRVCIDYEALDVYLEHLGVTAALVLLELGATAYQRRGRFASRTSERDLTRRLGRWGRGFSRGPIGAAVADLEQAGLLDRSDRGEYQLEPRLFGLPSEPRGDNYWPADGPFPGLPVDQIPGRVPAKTAPEAANLVYFPSQQVPAPSHDDVFHLARTTSSSSRTTADEHEPSKDSALAVSEAEKEGVRGQVLDRIRRDPTRALAWITYIRAEGCAQSLPRYLNKMMLDPAKPYPPDFDPGTAWHAVATPEGVRLLSASSESYSPAQSATPRVATVALIDAALQSAIDGVPLEDHPEYAADYARHAVAVERERGPGLRAHYLAHYRALCERGLLLGTTPPFEGQLGNASSG